MTKIRFDFRSDTVTKPSTPMLSKMMSAEVGDDVFGDDPTVNRLEACAAELLGKDAALFAPTGTQTNLLGLMSHCGRGDEYLVGQMAHTYRMEGGGAAILGSIQPQPIEHQTDGTLALDDIEAAIKPDDAHYAMTKLLALENTFGGTVLPMAYIREATDLARAHNLNCHLDGARAFNAVTELGVPISELAASFDTVSICLSKGLGAPVGSLLIGSQDLIDRARRLRKMVGGGMRQAGILAAAGLYALENNVERLADDHANAKLLAEGLNKFDGISVKTPETNILWVEMDARLVAPLNTYLKEQGIALTSPYGDGRQRWVTHLDVPTTAIETTLSIINKFF